MGKERKGWGGRGEGNVNERMQSDGVTTDV